MSDIIDPEVGGAASVVLSGVIIQTLINKGTITAGEATAMVEDAINRFGASDRARVRKLFEGMYPQLFGA